MSADRLVEDVAQLENNKRKANTVLWGGNKIEKSSLYCAV